MPVASSLCVTPMPPRITRKSTRPRASDRPMVDTVQPHGLIQFRNRLASSLLTKMQLLRWNNPGHHTTRASSMVKGAECREINLRIRRREKNVLDIPLYRSGHSAQNAAHAASSAKNLAKERIAFSLSSRRPRSSSWLSRFSYKSLPKTSVSREPRKSYLRLISLRRSVR